MEAKYYKDLSHNYLILKINGGVQKNEYSSKMITENRIRHLLPCSTRNINDEVYFYYEISSKQSIKSLYERGCMKYEQIYHLFEHINEASKEVKEYLLEDSHILLHPEYIYATPEEEEFFFIYYPGESIDDMPIMPLAEYLLEKADRENEKTVQIIYQIYEYIQDGKFILPEVIKIFDEPVSVPTPAKGQIAEEKEESGSRTWDEYEDEDCEDIQEDNQESNAEVKSNMIISTVLLMLCIGAIIGIFCIRYLYILSIEESVLTIAGIITLVIISSFLLLSLIVAPVKGKKRHGVTEPKKKEVTEAMNQYMTVDTYFQEKDERMNFAQKEKTENDIYGSTVFIEASLYSTENKLYGINKGNKYHIDLKHLPCTVGKMAGSVDAVIKDKSVSRMHARFTRREDGIYVTDLNSTNGTFKNGLRLEPNETVFIETGDEIRFGNMTFCYR